MLDSRTRRKFSGQAYEPPDLIGNNRDEQIPKGPFTDEHELLFVVAPAPVFGPELIESLGWPLAVMLTDLKIKDNGLGRPVRGRRRSGARNSTPKGGRRIRKPVRIF